MISHAPGLRGLGPALHPASHTNLVPCACSQGRARGSSPSPREAPAAASSCQRSNPCPKLPQLWEGLETWRPGLRWPCWEGLNESHIFLPPTSPLTCIHPTRDVADGQPPRRGPGSPPLASWWCLTHRCLRAGSQGDTHTTNTPGSIRGSSSGNIGCS